MAARPASASARWKSSRSAGARPWKYPSQSCVPRLPTSGRPKLVRIRDLRREDRAEGCDRQQERRRERTSGTTPRTERERREQQRQRKEERPRQRQRAEQRAGDERTRRRRAFGHRDEGDGGTGEEHGRGDLRDRERREVGEGRIGGDESAGGKRATPPKGRRAEADGQHHREREQHRLHGDDALAPDGAADGGKEHRIARKAQRLGHERLARSRPREFAAFDQTPREREVLDLVVAPWLRVGAERGGVRRGEGDREERERGDGQVRARGPRRGQPRPSRIEQPSWPRIG